MARRVRYLRGYRRDFQRERLTDRSMDSKTTIKISLGLILSQIILCSSAQAQTSQQDMRKRLVGQSAYAACKMIHANYSQQRVNLIVETAIKENNWESQKAWLRLPKTIQTIKTVTEAMNSDCSDFNQDSPKFIPAMHAIDAL